MPPSHPARVATDVTFRRLTPLSLSLSTPTCLPAQTQHLLIPYLAPHLANLTASIRRLALIQYFQPFASVSFPRMATAFGLPEHAVRAEVTELVRTGEVRARVDLWGDVLRAEEVDERRGLFERALEEGERAERETMRAIVRMRL